MDKNSTHGLKPDRLLSLLSIGADWELICNEVAGSDEKTQRFFQSLLHRKIPNESSIVDSILIFLRESKAFGKAIVDHSLWDILSDPDSSLELLKTIKDYSKKIYQSTVSKGENSIAVAIYYAAIASGLIYHDTKISAHSCQTLKEAFTQLMQEPWMVPEIKQLFSAADGICQSEHPAE